MEGTLSNTKKEVMEHALGLNRSKEVTRNHYYTDADDKVWNELVQQGLATKRPGWDEESAYFKVTEKGIELVCSPTAGV